MNPHRRVVTGLTALLFCFAIIGWCSPRAAAADKSTDAARPAAKIDLNTATADQLEELPGIGEVTSKKIIENRPYKSIDDLTKAGLSEAKIAKIAHLVTIGGKPAAATSARPAVKSAKPAEQPAAKIDLNTATAEQLDELPGVGEATAKKIIDSRPYKSVDELSKAGLSTTKIAKLEPLVTTGRPTGSRETRAGDKAAVAGKIDLNSASTKELEELPGVGAATAAKIIAARPFKSVADLSKAGLTEKQIARFESQVTVAKPAAQGGEAVTAGARSPSEKSADKIDLNTASEKELEELPGVGKATAAKIIAGRPYKTVSDLTRAGLTEKQISKIEPQVTVGKSETASRSRNNRQGATADNKSEPTGPTVARTPPTKGMVWVNTESGVYHKEGDRWYGRTKEGKWLTESEAQKAGYREAK